MYRMWLVDWLLVVGAFVVIQEKSLKWQPSLAAVCVSVVYLYYVVDGGSSSWRAGGGSCDLLGIDNKRSRTLSPDTWNVTSDTWNGTQTHPQIKPTSHQNDDGLQNHGNLATLQAHI